MSRVTTRVCEQVEKAPLESYADIGGLEDQIQEIKEAVELPLTHPELCVTRARAQRDEAFSCADATCAHRPSLLCCLLLQV
jgi:SpoVK/Ycf46/Vps4 family AAA+-type ATPase